MSGPIIFVEPLCRGFEHAQYNTPLITSAAIAYPGVPIIYMAEQTHLDHVRTMLAGAAPGVAVEWQAITIPSRGLSPLMRMKAEYALLRSVIVMAARTKARAVISASATDTAALAVKLLLHRTKPPCPVLVVLHSVLAGLEDRTRSFGPLRGIRLATSVPHPKGLQFIVPGRPIQEYLNARFPEFAVHCRPLDHPSFWAVQESALPDPAASVRFGFFGVSAVPGFDLVVQIARELKAEGCTAEFSMVGHLNHPDDPERDHSPVPDAGPGILTPAEYRARAQRLTYALWTTRTHRSGLVASSTFLDALSYIKPIIYLSNPLIDGYARELGDIGYRCEDAAAMKDIVRRLAAEPPGERYLAQCRTIQEGRRAFDPMVVGGILRTIIEETGRPT
jgi:hypothetical protein